MKKSLSIVFLFMSLLTFGQVADNFSDGNFTSNPVWTPDNPANWVIENEKLQSNSSIASSSFYITTPSNRALNAQWEFSINLQFNTSSTNLVDIYLTSEQNNLNSATNNGYFVRIGGTPDEVSLYKMTAGVASILINGTDGVTNSSSNLLRIKVIRSATNAWSLERDATGGTTYISEGTVTDNSFTTSNFFGFRVQQSTTSFHNKHFFDDVYAGAIIVDSTPPTLQSITVNSATSLNLLFSERLDLTSAQNVANYQVNHSIGNPSGAVLQADEKTVQLTFSTSFTNGVSSDLTVSGVKDLVGNSIVTVSEAFLYFVPQPVVSNDIVINELFPDPSPQIGLPTPEFVEVFNRSNKPFDLNGWKLSDPTTTATLPSVILLPGEYLILTTTAGATAYASFGKVIGLSNFPTLNNGSDAIKLSDPSNQEIDLINYELAWYQDDDKAEGGWTLERFNPSVNTNDPTNWKASDDASGGTPGKQNSIFGVNPDSKPPQLLNLAVINSKELMLEFNESLEITSVQELLSYTVNNSIDNPESATLSLDAKSVHITFRNNFVNGLTYSLAVKNIKDLAGNTLSDTERSFIYFIPVASAPKDIVINEIMADPSPVVQLPEAEYIEIFNRSLNAFDLNGWKLFDATSSATLGSYIMSPNSFLVLTSAANASKFAAGVSVLSITGFPSLNNTGEPLVLKNNLGQTIDSVNYKIAWHQDKDKTDGGWALERFNPETDTNDPLNWKASEDVIGGTPGKQNSLFGKNPDSKQPQLLTLTVINSKELMLEFNEPLERLSAQELVNYTAKNAIGYPTSATLSTDAKFVHLVFQNAFTNGLEYSLTLKNVKDLAGNGLADTEKSFIYFIAVPSAAKDIIITEIMADPSPVVHLPEAEYIEIFNRSTNAFDLNGWKLADGTGAATIGSYILQPNSFLILTSSSNSTKFSAGTPVLSVVSFPSLNNSGEPLVLKNKLGQSIDSVNFTLNWYGDDEKKDGGWSLELIDPQNICGEGNNWTASEDERGGTPGSQNSVLANKPDLTGPKLLSVTPVQLDEIILQFDEKLEKNISSSYFSFSPAIEISNFAFTDLSLRQIQINTNESLRTSQLYTITVSQLRDCNGNYIQENFNSYQMALPEVADSLDVLINEVLFNPRTGGVDFVEVYNNSAKYINLKNAKLTNYEEEQTTNEVTITSNDFLFSPGEYLVLTKDAALLKSYYPQYNGMKFLEMNLPGLSDDEGSIVFLSSEKIISDYFHYTAKYHSPLLKDEEGVSLERISFDGATNDPANWRSATFDAGYATPGFINSNTRPETSIETDEIKIVPEIFSVNASGSDFAQIEYKFEDGGKVANVKVIDQQGHIVKQLTNNTTISYDGSFRWDGDRDDGTLARSGYYFVWFEVFDLNGNQKTYRKRVVLAAN